MVDPDEQERLQTIATDLIRAFVQEGLKKLNIVAEVASLAVVLGQDDFRKLLQQNPDPYLIYQAAYAYQALLYIPDDETILQSMMRHTGKVAQGISGVVSTVKTLDLIGFIEGLQNVQQGLAGAETTIGLISDACSNAIALATNEQGLVQEGRFADFENLVQEAPCQHDTAFRLGVCQRLGEIAASPVWDPMTRKCAVEFLRQLYKDDASNGQKVNIKRRILCILSQLAESSKDIIEGSAQELLQEVQASSSHLKGAMHRGYGNDILALHPIMVIPPPTESPLLDCVQSKIDVETSLRKLKRERLQGRDGDVYISPRAKATSRATDHLDLTANVQEFLASDRKVSLILGDSGAGKSTFNRALEISLWENYKTNRIPLFPLAYIRKIRTKPYC
ncbi:hypothetical protein BGZ80_004708 [Entomortierella chlamydospora]|uniref:Arm-like repeat domain-containing protein n=1 Tax=Entomortierella chlamydospora TaxID=101097 RepID=A0A9P6MLX9_9FUNG|nr:hypothetical protein BGZ80_004708 [Entomortierella chlamydospora]